MTIIAEPLHIGAPDLLRGVEHTYSGEIDVKCDTIFAKKWKRCYGIISQGCLYIYANRKSKKVDQSFSFKVFESAAECDPESGENICFCLRYKTGKAPLLFSCDTLERREEWIDKFNSAITEVQSTLYNLSADSGIGSAETLPKHKAFKVLHWNDEPGSYDEVDQTNVQECVPVQPSEDDSGYEKWIPKHMTGAKSINKDMSYENVYVERPGIMQSDIKPRPQRKMQHFMEELKETVTAKHLSAMKPATDNSAKKASALPRRRLPQSARPSNSQSSLPAATSLESISSSFLSVSGRDCASTEESLSHLSVRGHESDDDIYENEDDTGSSNDSDRTSRKTIYENREELKSMEPHRFEMKDYFCDRKEKVKRILKQKSVGVFAVSPGVSTQYELCVMTPHDLKYFRIYNQNYRVSLYKTHQLNTFSSLDDLLSYYNVNDLPSTDYNVKLLRGYNSIN